MEQLLIERLENMSRMIKQRIDASQSFEEKSFLLAFAREIEGALGIAMFIKTSNDTYKMVLGGK